MAGSHLLTKIHPRPKAWQDGFSISFVFAKLGGKNTQQTIYKHVGNNLKMTNSTTNKLLLINVILIVLMFIANEFWTELGLTDS
ncbi:hypothetical protein LV92_03150 [Arenibacter echinorum]|uniref:Uncharacterized protein n=1 Tax=Arenibacter echinorum TaxID=440515 RepID=A0A327QZ62_9FLAO|nr:hypothetical protein LV92_03150 [Arenibacter echinorum]